MPSEAEKRLHRCCFSGHRPEKLDAPEFVVKLWLKSQIDDAISAGFRTFICGMAMGVDIWAGEIVLEKKAVDDSLRLICAVPWPGFPNNWSIEWHERYSAVLAKADLVVPIARQFAADVFWRRNTWMVDHSSRLIAFYNGAPGGTQETIDYARRQGIEVITNEPLQADESSGLRESGSTGKPSIYDESYISGEAAFDPAVRIAYPENLLRTIGLAAVFGKDQYEPLNDDQFRGLEYILGMLSQREREILLLRYREQRTLAECGKIYGFSKQRAQQIEARALRKLHHPGCLMFVRDGFEKSELSLKIACAEEIKRCLVEQKQRYPLMNEEDVVKFAFQGMLGVGHLVSSEEEALSRLRAEMEGLSPDMEEPLCEKISTYWLRVNLRAALAREKSFEELAYQLFRSARMTPVSFTRQNVYNFCMRLEGYDPERMKAAALRVLEENWLPRHSETYREAYHPAYRVMYKDYRKFRKGRE